MTTFQLAMRLAENLTTPNWARLSLNEAEKLREALQTGLSEFARLLPAHRQRQPVSQTMRAPLTQEVNIVSGSNEFAYVAGGAAYPAGGYAKEADALGMLVTVGSDPYFNRLILPGQLLRAHIAGSGNTAMTIYGDCIPMGSHIWHMVGTPRWLGGGNAQDLFPWPAEKRPPHTLVTGTPRYWWTEALAGSSRGTTPLWVMRVWPVPVAIGIIELEVAAFPTAISFLDLHDEPRALPATPDEEPYLVALCEEALLKHPLWREDVQKSEVRASAESARRALNERNRPTSTQHNKVGTPSGW